MIWMTTTKKGVEAKQIKNKNKNINKQNTTNFTWPSDNTKVEKIKR